MKKGSLSINLSVQADEENYEKKDEICMVIGQAIKNLITSGKVLNIDNLIAHLKLSEGQSLNGMKLLYADAIRSITNKVG